MAESREQGPPPRQHSLMAGIEKRAEQREKDRARYEAARDSLQKFSLAGNAGGAIAALSLIGTTLARSAPGAAPSYPWVYFATLVVFVVGLGGGWVALSAKARRVKGELRREFENMRTVVEATAQSVIAPRPRVEGTPPTRPRRRKAVPIRTRLARLWAAASTEDLGVALSALMLLVGTFGGLAILATLARWS